MGWLTLLLNLSRFLAAVSEMAKARSDRAAGRAEAMSEILNEATSDIRKAVAARNAVRDRHLRDPASVQDDDGYRRD